MNNPMQHRRWILGIYRQVAGAALAFAIMLVPAVLATGSAQAQTFKTLVSFNGTDGGSPYSSLVQGLDGNLYGTTYTGGANNNGTVFKVTPTGTLTMLYSFCSQPNCTDGAHPPAGLVLATNGNFYGTTVYGGAYGYGTVFKITPTGTLTTLYSFQVSNCDTYHFISCAGLTQATNENFYGTTVYGGANNAGMVFEITPGGTLTTLYSFCSATNCSDGANPTAALVQANNGNFYGTTRNGGTPGPACSPEGGCGTVFEITGGGKLTTLYDFDYYPDGQWPQAGLVQATNGNFYGTAYYGGINIDGSVFEIRAGGKLTTLHSFDVTDGSRPVAGLVQATDGNFYGTTPFNGANPCCEGNGAGTAFKITPSGTLTTLYNFCSQTNCTDGANPFAGLVQDTNGTFYGTTYNGGASGVYGTVFSLSVGLGPFVKTLPTSGKVGAVVKILGTNLTGATSVTFNGTAATFTVVSKSEIKTTVPTGATTGKVEVTTPEKTLKSNVAFRVTPQIFSFTPTSGPVGTPVTITGDSLTQTTKVTFGGVKATNFTVNSDTQVTAYVPTGAKTGKIAITTPGGTAVSSGIFTVTQ